MADSLAHLDLSQLAARVEERRRAAHAAERRLERVRSRLGAARQQVVDAAGAAQAVRAVRPVRR